MPIIEVNSIKLYYEINGTGEPIIFTHGHSMYHKQWDPQVKPLSKNYQTIVWDVRGHGNSSLPLGDVDPEDFSRDLISLLDYLGIESAVLCGLSMGGHISIQTAVRYPERVKGLILIGTPFTNSFNWFEKYSTPISKLSLRFIPFHYTSKWTADIISKINPDNHAFVMEAFSKMTKDNFLRHWSGNLRMESRHDLHKIQCPTMILHGDKDNMVGRQQQYLAKNIMDAEFFTITNAHHLTNRDNPEEVTDYITQFMNRWE
ncbi:alpha/beta fold hydrolase [Sutcliffiella rhizosphaerae]|uniref:Arylesterase n=1 Tax=Sutcliffiella rhizosphaerae TaxID=2880967 RepID=A0ABM8YQP0_9BACI|nr:alpha/beta hydrolase [Sutcliffiella rhizosphaerae]CAG9622315.1 Arylesterase [Sutcliffiella rhizosphaerae]